VRSFITAAGVAALVILMSSSASAQTGTDPAERAAAPSAPAQAADRDDAVLVPAQPDFTLVALPTGLRLPARKLAFRVTHRFQRSLGQGDFGDLAGDAFGLDNGAITAIELRYGLLPGTQIGVHRSALRKTIEFFAQHDLLSRDGGTTDVSVFASIDGTGNFKDSYTPAIGGIFTKIIGNAAAVYVEPMWVNNSNPDPSELVDHNDTVLLGLGARFQLRPATYFVVEWSPRVAGFDPLVDAVAFGLEKRLGGHMFQINFSNNFATTMGQIARGGLTNDDWYLGFNIVRKFY
jgi:uncharacterized beta barrel domain-containing protein DUF5777